MYYIQTLQTSHSIFYSLNNRMTVTNTKDIYGAVAVLAVAVVPIVLGVPSVVLDTVETSPLFVKGVWVAVIAALLYKKYVLTALVVVVLGLTVRYEVFGSYVYSPEGILAAYKAAQERDPRFNKNVDLDLQIGEGTLTRDPARWLDRGRPSKPLLLFPPTLEQLALTSNNGHLAPVQ